MKEHPIRFARLLWAALLLLPIAACSHRGPAPQKDDSRDPLAYAADIKNLTVHTLTLAGKARRENALGQIETLRSGLAQYPENPVGPHRETYAQLLADAEELLGMFQSSASAAAVKSKIDAMIATAQSLPGDLQPLSPE